MTVGVNGVIHFRRVRRVELPGRVEGTVDHESGRITLNGNHRRGDGIIGSTVYVTYTPAAQVSQPAHTKAIPITLATRGSVYSVPLLPIPAPGTLIVDYHAPSESGIDCATTERVSWWVAMPPTARVRSIM